jgi:GTP cyclohydrolase I
MRMQGEEVNEDKMSNGIEMLLEGMGVNLADENFHGTPRRVARMYAEMLSPEANSWATFPASASDLVLLRNHRVVAICPHHLLPVEIVAHVGYIPAKLTLGLSKLARAVESHLVQPVLQEDLADYIANSLNEHLDPKGIGVVLAGTHGCMRFRGVRTDGDVVTSVMRGVLLLNPAARQEFLSLIGRP